MEILFYEKSTTPSDNLSDCVIIFLGLDIPDAFIIDDAYVDWTNSHVPPPTTVIIGELLAMKKFVAETSNKKGRILGLDRLYGQRETRTVVLGGFDFKGSIEDISETITKNIKLNELFFNSVKSYIDTQIDNSDVVIPAPLGTYFEKLSDRFSSHFIRAEALLTSTTTIELLALRLLKPLNEWINEADIRNDESINIYIDTMSVWPVAEKLRQFHLIGNPNSPSFTIDSFKSYDGLEKWNPQKRPSFIIISASTSGGLAEKIRTKIGESNAEIWTILGLESTNEQISENSEEPNFISLLSRKLNGRPALNGLRDYFEPNIKDISPGTETISIVGERFLSQTAKPKRVRLVHKTLDETTKEILAKIAKKHIVKISRVRFDAQSRWSISFDLQKIIGMASTAELGEVDSLVKGWIKDYSPEKPVAIIYPSADGAAATEVAKNAAFFAQRILDTIKESNPNAEVFKLSSDELTKTSIPFAYDLNDCNAIIAAPIIGNGFILKQISATLRQKQPKGKRLFLAISLLPESKNQLNQLRSDITSCIATEKLYDFKYQFSLAIGKLDATMDWKKEINLLSELEQSMSDSKIDCQEVTTRTELLTNNKPLEDKWVFLPSPLGLPLPLSSGFFLWPDNSSIEGDNFGGAVLLSVATLLQEARTTKSSVDATSLVAGLFQHALICPETFTRYNDPVIQAAILRAAYPAELNYSVSSEMSHDMERLLIKWLRYYEHVAGAAIGEFILAIGTGKLTLRKEGLVNVFNSAKECTGWLKCLIEIVSKRVLN